MSISDRVITITGLDAGGSFASVASRVAQTLRALSNGSGVGACPELGAVKPYGGAAVAIPFATTSDGEFRAIAAICHAHGFRIIALVDGSGMNHAERDYVASVAHGMSADDVRWIDAGSSLSADYAA